tara:strand:- start:1264 stop:1719 length:456 start_codon:yes stop_codon:yes gene_type:complete
MLPKYEGLPSWDSSIEEDFDEYEYDHNPATLKDLIDIDEEGNVVGSAIDRLRKNNPFPVDPQVAIIIMLLRRYKYNSEAWASQVVFGNGACDLAKHLEEQLQGVCRYLTDMDFMMRGEFQHFENIREMDSFRMKRAIDERREWERNRWKRK